NFAIGISAEHELLASPYGEDLSFFSAARDSEFSLQRTSSSGIVSEIGAEACNNGIRDGPSPPIYRATVRSIPPSISL
ncbi:MAG: hypothetical protein O6952_09110, partial [Planctomycetota bacterium]|nr:hypothetical protein [Planctomycetota bacterium]